MGAYVCRDIRQLQMNIDRYTGALETSKIFQIKKSIPVVGKGL
jgi:hypothetical protein